MKTVKTDCLIIGTGLAGCATALELSKAGINTLMITKTSSPEISSSFYAQGGIIFKAGQDSPEKIKSDIIEAGDSICNIDAVDALIEWGPRLVKEILIDEIGISFDIKKDGEYDLTEEGGHSIPRILHVGDYTGREIEEHFVKYLRSRGKVDIMTEVTALDLLTLSHHSSDHLDIYREPACVGAYVYDQKKSEVFAVICKEVVLATGGLGQIFLHTSNPQIARGDGYTMANRAGAKMLNMEYVQFHPTTLYSRSSNERFLISESLRGEGAKLLNRFDKEFMHNYHKMGSLAPRDIVARAIHEEMLKNGDDHVYLDISFKPSEWIRSRFPHIHSKCLEQGIDITNGPVPVVPAAHYSCGGVVVDQVGRTSLKNLRAVGEVSCSGVHGANRLASTSLLEDVVWGIRTGRDVAKNIKKGDFYIPDIRQWKDEREEVDPALIRQDWLMIKHTMWNYVGLVRTAKRLERARAIMSGLTREIESFYANCRLSDNLIGLRNGVRTANLVLNFAHRNRISRGCHYINGAATKDRVKM